MTKAKEPTFDVVPGIKKSPDDQGMRRGPKAKYPFRAMMVGDSFLVPEDPEAARALRMAVNVFNSNERKKGNVGWVLSVAEDMDGNLRVFRDS